MNRTTGFLWFTDVAPAPLVAVGATVSFSLLLVAVLTIGLPIWSLLIFVAAIVYGFMVLHQPIIGVYVVVAVFFVPHQFSTGISLLQSVGAGTATILLVWFLYHRRKIVFGSFMIPLLLLGPLILVSLWYTHDATTTLMYFRRWVFNMMFVLLLVNLITRFDLFKKVLWAIMIMASINAVVAMVDYSTSTMYNYRSKGLMENPNGFGHLAALAFPLALYQYLYRKGWMRWLGLLMCAVLAGGIVASVSRGALTSLIIVLGVVAIVERRRLIPIVVVLGLMFSSIPLLPNYFVDRVGNLALDVKNSIMVGNKHGLTSRGNLNTAGLRIWAAHPILGVGIGNFGFYYNQREFIGGMTAGQAVVAHNVYLQALSEMGTVGGLLLFWLLLNSALSLRRARRATAGSDERKIYFGGIEMMTLSILVSTASSGSLMGNNLWMFLGLTMIAGRVAVAEAEA